MSEELSRCKTEQEIRARFRCAPGYYLQAKLEKRRALAGRQRQTVADTEQNTQAVQAEESVEPAPSPESGSLDITAFAPERAKITAPASRPRKATSAASKSGKTPAAPKATKATKATTVTPKPTKASTVAPKSRKATRCAPEAAKAPAPAPKQTKLPLVREVPDFALPGFEILDAALAESDGPGPVPAAPLEPAPAPGLTQQAILAVALEGYSNWPFLSDAEPEQAPQPSSELERKLALVLASEPELELVLDSDSALDLDLELEPGLISDNVTVANFRKRAPRTIRVVSVAMDRKRPNMVRVTSESTRLAS